MSPPEETTTTDHEGVIRLAELQDRGDELLHRAQELAQEAAQQLRELTPELPAAAEGMA